MKQMQTGARTGKINWLRGLAARATAQSLQVFVVPEPEFARRIGIDLEAIGLKVTTTPRHANVLLLIGEIPPGLAKAVAVIYSQMLRPRAIMLIGSGPLPSLLPEPDVQTGYDLAKIGEAVQQLRQLFLEKAWLAEETADFAGPADSPDQPEAADEHAQMHHGEMPAMMGHSMPVEKMPPEGHETHQMDMAEISHSDHSMTMSETEHSDHNKGEMDRGEMPYDHTAMMSQVKQADHAPHNTEHSDRAMSVKAPVQASMEEMEHPGHDMSQMNMGEMEHGNHAESSSVNPGDNEKGNHDMSMPETTHPDHTMSQMNMDGMNHSSHDMATMEHGGHDMSGHSMAGMDHSGHDMDQMEMAGMDHSGHDMSGMNHGGHDMMMGGFMSMVAMTQDLPRSRDGLPMEWVETPFGPLFPGLRAGLALNFTLDGEEVAQAKVIPGTLKRELAQSWPGSVANFPDRLAHLDPLTPVSYRLLALQALEQAAEIKIDEIETNRRIAILERERIVSHLGWLAKLAGLLGDNQLTRQTARLQLDLVKAESLAETIRLRPMLLKLKEGWQKAPLLKTRLAGKGRLVQENLEGVTGPVARAGALDRDARQENPAYLNLGFKPRVQKGGDTLARLMVRLAELEQSFDLIVAANSLATLDETVLHHPFHEKVSGTSRLETPRGTATLSLTIAHNAVSEVKLDTPSTSLVKLIGQVSQGQDLADALVSVASLDLSPWELEQ